jgi:hypothetical protein
MRSLVTDRSGRRTGISGELLPTGGFREVDSALSAYFVEKLVNGAAFSRS